jgi:hypothetical protein
MKRRGCQNKRDSNEDLEQAMISKLKENAGFSFTSKLEGMFNDISTSAEILNRFKDSRHCSAGYSFELVPQVLNSSHWPISQNSTLQLVDVLNPAVESFGKFYSDTHQSRKLQWVHSQGVCTIVMELKRRKHELSMSTYQACILLQFNGARSIPVKDLVQRLSITEDELHKSVEPLLAGKYKVLLKERGASGVPVLSWNIKWTPDKIRISLPHAMARITRKESEVIKKVVEVDRSVQIDAAIVRIMKMRRRCAHAQLVSEVMAQLVSHFKADPKQVCQRACHRAPRDPQGVADALCRV